MAPSGTLEIIETRIKAGIERLDAMYDGDKDWLDRINLDALSMDSIRNCILGQLYGLYSIGVDQLGLDDSLTETPWHATLFGFNSNSWVNAGAAEEPYTCFDLDEPWRRAITALRKERNCL